MLLVATMKELTNSDSQDLTFIKLIGNPFSFDIKLRNLCSGSSVAVNYMEGILKCIDVGDASGKNTIGGKIQDPSRHARKWAWL